MIFHGCCNKAVASNFIPVDFILFLFPDYSWYANAINSLIY